MDAWELIIIGAGSAGLAAGIYANRSGLRTLVVEEKIAGGTTAEAPLVENYPGLQSITGSDLTQKMLTHAKSAGTIIKEFETVTSMDLKSEPKTVKTSRATYETKTVIIASGSRYKKIGIPGEAEFRGRGVSYCGICDGPLFSGKRVLVVGGGNSALITALYLAGIASDVKVAHRRDTFRAEEALVKALKEKSNIDALLNTEVKQVLGDKLVNGALLLNNKSGETKELPIDGIFVQVGEEPNSQFAKEAGVAVDEDGYVIVDRLQRTNIPGVYAAGDITNHPVKQIGTAVGQGITAAMEAYGHIRRPYYHEG
jgi:thioredoxin reductase (NADPH)